MLDLVSVHIPKTGGTSFLACLRHSYPKVCVRSWPSDDILNPNQPVEKPDSPILHGHFPLACYKEWITHNTMLITWVRHPVERIVSHWQHVRKGNKSLTLDEFCESDSNKNMMSRMLQGYPLGRFTFVGVFDFFADDLVNIQGMLAWKKFVPHKNKGREAFGLSQDMTDKILMENQEDLHLYFEAVRLRQALWS